MAVLIKNMDMSKTCDGCFFYDDISRYCDAANRRLYKIDQPKPRWCPIEEVKTMASNVEGKKDITVWILDHLPEDGTVLDVGACDGVWAKFLLSLDPDIIIDGVEAYELNVIMHNLKRFYRNVYTMDVADLEYDWYDFIIFGDVIEHMTVEKAQRVLKYAWDRCDDMIVAVPYMYPQDAIYGNPWEIHKQPDLTPENFDERYPGFEPLWQNDFYGYYHKRR